MEEHRDQRESLLCQYDWYILMNPLGHVNDFEDLPLEGLEVVLFPTLLFGLSLFILEPNCANLAVLERNHQIKL